MGTAPLENGPRQAKKGRGVAADAANSTLVDQVRKEVFRRIRMAFMALVLEEAWGAVGVDSGAVLRGDKMLIIESASERDEAML